MVLDGKTPDAVTPPNLNFRSLTPGGESDLVQEYIGRHLPSARKGQARAIFVEPEIKTGYPDIVVAYWKESVAANWPQSRSQLTQADLRVLHLLTTEGSSEVAVLHAIHGSSFHESLERLASAQLVFQRGDSWHACSKRRSFALSRLIAIEAKLDDWRRGVCQAVKNTWFASESFLLIPCLPKASEVKREAERLGVGVLTRETPLSRPLIQPQKAQLPRSYGSWLFNEWVWRVQVSTSARQE